MVTQAALKPCLFHPQTLVCVCVRDAPRLLQFNVRNADASTASLVILMISGHLISNQPSLTN